MNKKAVDWRSVNSMSDDCELEKLEEWASAASLDSDYLSPLAIEIGAWKGKTTAILAQFFNVWVVDLWGDLNQGLNKPELIGRETWPEFIGNMTRLDLLKRVTPMVTTSDFLLGLGAAQNNPEPIFDFAFVDGAHDYESVWRDLLRVVMFMKEDAPIVLHDYKRPGYGYPPYDPNHPHHGPVDPWSGVQRAVDDFVQEYPYEIKEHYEGIVLLGQCSGEACSL